MKLGQTTSWLYFCNLCFTGTHFVSIDWLSGTKPIRSIENTAVLGTSSKPCTNIWVGEADVATDVS